MAYENPVPFAISPDSLEIILLSLLTAPGVTGSLNIHPEAIQSPSLLSERNELILLTMKIGQMMGH